MNTLKVALYVVCVLSSSACAFLLFRGYMKRRTRLLMWSGICFVGLSINNLALFFDLVLFPQVDLRLARLMPALAGMLCLLYGFIWDTE